MASCPFLQILLLSLMFNAVQSEMHAKQLRMIFWKRSSQTSVKTIWKWERCTALIGVLLWRSFHIHSCADNKRTQYSTTVAFSYTRNKNITSQSLDFGNPCDNCCFSWTVVTGLIPIGKSKNICYAPVQSALLYWDALGDLKISQISGCSN